MPELPEVETIVRGLSREILNRVCSTARVRTPSIVKGDAALLEAAMPGRRVSAIERHGKAGFIHLSAEGNAVPEVIVLIRLGMTGQLIFEKPSENPAPHTHAAFQFKGNPR